MKEDNLTVRELKPENQVLTRTQFQEWAIQNLRELYDQTRPPTIKGKLVSLQTGILDERGNTLFHRNPPNNGFSTSGDYKGMNEKVRDLKNQVWEYYGKVMSGLEDHPKGLRGVQECYFILRIQ